jgi:hypothetical protein
MIYIAASSPSDITLARLPFTVTTISNHHSRCLHQYCYFILGLTWPLSSRRHY